MTKLEAIEQILCKAAEKPFREHEFREMGNDEDKERFKNLLDEDGRFSDLEDTPEKASEAMQRLAFFSEDYHWKNGVKWPEGLKNRVLKAAAHYCKIETDQEDRGPSRFHRSIFRFPAVALNLHFMLYPDMELAEKEPENYPLAAKAREEILKVALQTFTLPERGDETDLNPISVERFRHHVWWVGGNALDYRPVFQTALASKSVEMMDVVVSVAARSISAVSQETAEEAFWQEGICADGFGWGHGRQAYNSGYPTDGLRGALPILAYVIGTPYEEELKNADFSSLVRYMRGITWCAYGDFAAPMQSRTIFTKERIGKSPIDGIALMIAKYLDTYFQAYLTEDEKQEVKELLLCGHSAEMVEKKGLYQGLRYFWNNEALIKKEKDCFFYVNMASGRGDGVEFAQCLADKRNYYTADGSYTLSLTGREYLDVMGTWQVAHLPGVTERYLPNTDLMPEDNWRGYRSKFDVAAGAVLEDNGVCGFLYEKDDFRNRDGVDPEFTKEMCGVQAYKSYFVLGDTICCLGAGITDVKPEYGREIHTTVNNTLLRGNAELVELDDYIQVENDDILYRIKKQEGNTVRMTAEKRRTSWGDLNLMNELQGVQDEECPVFELLIDHGEHPVDGAYEFCMCIRHKNPDSVRVLANTRMLQAAARADFSVTAAVFYDKEAVLKTGELEVWVSEPCVLLMKKEKNGWQIAVCDTQQKAGCSTVTVTLREGEKTRSLEVELPQKLYRGKQGEGFVEF